MVWSEGRGNGRSRDRSRWECRLKPRRAPLTASISTPSSMLTSIFSMILLWFACGLSSRILNIFHVPRSASHVTSMIRSSICSPESFILRASAFDGGEHGSVPPVDDHPYPPASASAWPKRAQCDLVSSHLIAHDAWHLAPGTWHLALGTWHSSPVTWDLAPCTWHKGNPYPASNHAGPLTSPTRHPPPPSRQSTRNPPRQATC